MTREVKKMNLTGKKKWLIGVVSLVVIVMLSGLFLIPSPATLAQSLQHGLSPPEDIIPGEVLVGNYLRVGINPGGTLGIHDEEPPPWPIGIGFQWAGDTPGPYTPTTESLAKDWWGEGYKIAYKKWTTKALETPPPPIYEWVDYVVYYYPSLGWPPPPETNIVPVSEKLLRDDDNAAVKEVKVKTKNNDLSITFIFTLLKDYPELNLETIIENTSSRWPRFIRDVVYTRIVDWDVCDAEYAEQNIWTSTDHAAYAWRFPDGELLHAYPSLFEHIDKVQLTVAGHDGVYSRDIMWPRSLRAQIPGVPPHWGYPLFQRMPVVSYVDLDAWDDLTARKPGRVVQSFIPITGDYNAGIYYKIGDLGYRSKASVYTVYQSNFPPFEGKETEKQITVCDCNETDEELPIPSDDLLAWIDVNYATRGGVLIDELRGTRRCNEIKNNQFWAHTFTDLEPPAGSHITEASFQIRTWTGDQTDHLLLGFITGSVSTWEVSLPLTPSPPPYPSPFKTIVLDLGDVGPSHENLLEAIELNGFLDVAIEDDSTVRCAEIHLIYGP